MNLGASALLLPQRRTAHKSIYGSLNNGRTVFLCYCDVASNIYSQKLKTFYEFRKIDPLNRAPESRTVH